MHTFIDLFLNRTTHANGCCFHLFGNFEVLLVIILS